MLNELLTVESNLLLALNHFDVRVDVFIKRVHAYIYIYMCFSGLARHSWIPLQCEIEKRVIITNTRID